jgi:hypothetical protein
MRFHPGPRRSFHARLEARVAVAGRAGEERVRRAEIGLAIEHERDLDVALLNRLAELRADDPVREGEVREEDLGGRGIGDPLDELLLR